MSDRSENTIETDGQSLVGARLAHRYRLEKVLGKGGMGVVYEAVQEDLGRRVAIKLISGSVSASGLARLRQEAEATARLGNPHIVQVTDFQHNPGEPPFIVMELLNGRSLRALLAAEGVIGWQRAARFGCQILEALSAAHAAQIIHRDIKPDNVFVISSAAVPDMIKLLDFGVAKLVADDARGMTAPGALIGTLAYMSPEVARGDSIDARSDLYAVAVSLYEAVAGRRPIEAHDMASLFAAISSAEPVPLQSICPHVPDAFAAVLGRSLRKSPAERFQLAKEMADALASCLGSNVEEPARTALGGYREGVTSSTTAATSVTGIEANVTKPLAGPPPVAAPVRPEEPPVATWAWPAVPSGPHAVARPSLGSMSSIPSGPPQRVDPPRADREKLARSLASASTWSLVCAGFGLVSCLFPVSIVGLVLGARAHRLGRELQAPVPLRATAGIVIGILACLGSLLALGFVLLVGLGDFNEKSVNARIATLEKSIGDKPSAPVLDHDTGCAMAELQLLQKGHQGHDRFGIGSFECTGALTQTKDRAQLAGVAFNVDFEDFKVNACFTKGATWTLSELRKDACPTAPP